MSVVDLVGWIAALSSASLAVPQGVRIASTRSVAGVSSVTWQTMLLAGFAWTAHGMLYGTQQIIWPNVLLAITAAWVLWQLTVARSLPLLRTWCIPMLFAAAAFGVDYWLGPLAFGIIAFVPGAVGQIAQLREILRVIDPAGVSMVALVAGFLNQVLWLAYALPSSELAVISVAIPIGILAAANIVALLSRRRRLARLRAAGADVTVLVDDLAEAVPMGPGAAAATLPGVAVEAGGAVLAAEPVCVGCEDVPRRGADTATAG